MRNMRHTATVKRPVRSGLDTRGQPKGQPKTVIAEWPCSVVQVSGAESEQNGGVAADAVFEVQGYTDPGNPILERDYLEINGRRLDVQSVVDPDMLGLIAVLTCGAPSKAVANG